MTRVVIAGGGIAGLAVAHALRKESPQAEVIVLEGHERPGGNIRTENINGYLCECGPDGFLDSAPATLALVDEVGLTDRLLRSRDEARRRFIFRRGRLREVPASPLTFAATRLLSTTGKLRVAMEPFARRQPDRDESIYDFAARRIGHEAARVMVGSMVSGVFAGDANALSLRSCFPKMWEMERDYGSLFRALVAKRKRRQPPGSIGTPVGTLTSFTGGMEDLVRALVSSLGDRVRTGTPVTALRERDRALSPVRPGGARAFTVLARDRPIEADALVLAGPAPASAGLVEPFDPALASLMSSIPGAPLAVVCLGYDEAALTADRGVLDGFGFLVPRGEVTSSGRGPRILGALWETSIYPGRAPGGKALLRVMIGGATDPEIVDLDETQLLSIVLVDLQRTMGLQLAPEFVHVVRHRRGIPQYTIGHRARMALLDARLRRHPGLFVAGNSYEGVSINACIEAAPQIAARVAEHLRKEIRLRYEAIAR
jgi:oxygen-dependent protoporphyrinogen oxidase